MLGLLMVLDIVLSASKTLGGLKLAFFTSSRLDNLVGWKTRRASESRDTRRYANKFGGRLWLGFGLSELIISLMLPVILNSQFGELAAQAAAGAVLVFILATFALSVVIVEAGLKKNFSD